MLGNKTAMTNDFNHVRRSRDPSMNSNQNTISD